MMKGGYKNGFKGGVTPTHLGPNKDGFAGIESHKASFGVGEGTEQVGRCVTVGFEEEAKGGRSKGGK